MTLPAQHDERRRFQRKVPTEPIPVRNALTDDVVGNLGNVSAEGLMLIGPLNVGENLLMQLTFSVEAKDGSHAHVNLGAETLWCSPALRPDSYWTGLKIIDIDENDAALLEDLLDQL